MAARCPRCEKAVYFAEEVKQSGQSWHRSCFRCMKCNTNLDSNNFTEHGGVEIYCRGCHAKKFGTGGYGYGQGAGVLQTDREGPAAGRLHTAQTKQNEMASKFGGAAMKCPRCRKGVYAAERVSSGGKDYHKSCFTCTACNKTLEVGSNAEHEGNIYCKPCHTRNFGPKGVGFGIGAGALST